MRWNWLPADQAAPPPNWHTSGRLNRASLNSLDSLLKRISQLELTTLNVEKLVYGGDGLGRLPEGEVLFVPWSAPGDQLQVSRVAGSAKPAKGQIDAILQPGPDRVEPRCSVFGQCGGCQWQQVAPTAQRDWKRAIVKESLERIGKLPNVDVRPTLGSDDTAWAYRNRAQWEVEPAGDELTDTEEYHLGYHAAQSHTVVEFEHCHIIPDRLNELALALRKQVRKNPALASGLLRIEAMINRSGQILLTFEGERTPALDALAQTVVADFPDMAGIAHKSSQTSEPTMLQGQPFITETLDGNDFQVSVGSFFQTNRKAAEQILHTLDELMLPDTDSLLDLYAGVGVFALHFKEKARRILAVESSRSAMADARQNCDRQSASHIELKAGDARAVLKGLKEKFDVAIIDPPRAGCQPDVLNWLSSQVKRQLLYVSCNPTTLARDLKFLAAQGWQVQAVQPIDMFPQTYHVETVVSLVREPA